MKPILCIPDSQLAGIGIQPITSVIDLSKEVCLFSDGLFLGKLGDDPKSGMIRIAAKAKKAVDVRLRDRKSEGRLCDALRFFDMGDLLGFRGEQTQLFDLGSVA